MSKTLSSALSACGEVVAGDGLVDGLALALRLDGHRHAGGHLDELEHVEVVGRDLARLR